MITIEDGLLFKFYLFLIKFYKFKADNMIIWYMYTVK